MSLRSPLGTVLGTGSAKDGTAHWWAQRLSAVALVPLCLWFLWSLLSLALGEHARVGVWLAGPVNALLMILLVVALAYHASLGLSVVVEDYIPSKASRVFWLLLLRFLLVLAGGAAVLAVLRVALGRV
jgi:succinate dehydrogenase / fumarate reductase membrane anchor subunit